LPLKYVSSRVIANIIHSARHPGFLTISSYQRQTFLN
jgi:hypothetical protein